MFAKARALRDRLAATEAPFRSVSTPTPSLRSSWSISTLVEDGDKDSPELAELNEALHILTQVFPDVRIEVFREMLATFSQESRLFVVAEALLQHRAKFVKGRLRLVRRADADTISDIQPLLDDSSPVPVKERFRSDSYKKAVRTALDQEFRSLSQSSIKAVLAENNYAYLESRQTLLDITAKSWRSAIVNLLFRRTISSDTPLIDWLDAGRGPILHPTKSTELNEELEIAFIAPILRKRLQERVRLDWTLANKVNDLEAKNAGATFDCECCYSAVAFENVTICTASGHYICATCIQATAKEAMYGQGWARSIDLSRSALRCIASAGGDECNGCLFDYAVHRALDAAPETVGLQTKIQDKIAMQARLALDEPLLSCPFCPYAEVKPCISVSWSSTHLAPLKRTMPYSLIVLVSCISSLYRPAEIASIIWITLHVLVISLALLWLESPNYSWLSFTLADNDSASRPNQGRKFLCRNPDCARVSCLDCSAAWRDIHSCHSASRQSLRTYVEAAITDAVKRTCPRCNLSFVKSSGCNKLVCVCGYAMCYICRGHIGAESYSHFCPHFRPNGGPCGECSRCDLYKAEDDDAVVRRVRQQAEHEWWQGAEGRGLHETRRAEWAQQGVLGDMEPSAGDGLFERRRRAKTWIFG